MAYVRVRGKQIALVRSVRDPKRQEVSQEVLFVLYTREEARAALGRGVPGGAERFRALLQEAYPDHRFNWPAIRCGIEAHIEVLPESAPAETETSLERSRKIFHDFLRECAELNPRVAVPGHRPTLDALAPELRLAQELVGKQLAALQEKVYEAPEDASPLWRFGTRQEGPNPDVEEAASGLYERRELDAAEERFRILTEVFPRYAEGWNYLGCIALRRGDLPRARECFQTTVEIGRKLFPARIGRTSWWSLLETRPYIRGLHNLSSTLIREGRYPEAFAVADRLEKECFQEDRAALLRARVYLNSDRFAEAADEAAKLVQTWPSEAFPAGFASAERGDLRAATIHLLHAVLNHPLAAKLVTDGRAPQPRSSTEGRDWEVAEELRDNLRGYLAKRGRRGLTALRSLLRSARVRTLIDRVCELEQDRKTIGRAGFDELRRMKSLAFAREIADELLGPG